METLNHLIDTFHLEDLQNGYHPAMFDCNDEYDMLIVRMPVFEKKLIPESIGFIITAKESFLFDREKGEFKPLDDRFDGPYLIMDKMADNLLKSFSELQDLIDDMEERLYQNDPHKNFMTHWLSLKRDILRIERILMRTSNVLNEVNEHYIELEEFPINHYTDLHEHMDRTLRAAMLQLSKLDYLYNFYNARTNEKINRMIYILTIISSIFLPLNLIVGFFGMNTSDLPFSKEPSGTLYAFFLMVSLIVLSGAVLYLWRKRYKY